MNNNNLQIHRQLPGRIRVQIPPMKNNPELAGTLSNYARKSTFIGDSKFNARTGRALLVYDPGKISGKDIIVQISGFLQTIPEIIEKCHPDGEYHTVYNRVTEPEDQTLGRQFINVGFSSLVLLMIFLRQLQGKKLPWTQSPLLFNIAAGTTIITGYPFFKSGFASLVKGHKVNHDAILGLTSLVLVLLRESVPGLTVIWLASIISLIESIVLRTTLSVSREIVRENSINGPEGGKESGRCSLSSGNRDMQGSRHDFKAAEDYAHRISATSLGVAGLSYLTTGSIERSTAILLASSPGAAGQSQPSALATATALASRYGIVPAKPLVMAKVADIRTFVITRSTILAPDFTLGNVLPVAGITAPQCLSVASALGVNSSYFAGLFQEQVKSTVYDVSLETDSPEGAAGAINGFEALLGTEEFMLRKGVKTLLAEYKARRLKNFYQAPLFVAYNGFLLGVIGITRTVPRHNRELLDKIAALGVKIVLLTTENDHLAGPVKAQTGIEVISGVPPSEIPEIIDKLRCGAGVLAVLGVCPEDEGALEKADLPIAFKGGKFRNYTCPDLYVDSCQLVKVYQMLYIARLFKEKTEQNMLIVKGLNLAGLTLAASGKLSAPGGAIFNNITGIAVALNSLGLINKSIK